MRVTLLCFGVLKDVLCRERETMELAEGETLGGLLQLLEKEASKQSGVWKVLAVAVNLEYAARETVLRDGDEIALLPPVSGGVARVGA